MKRQGNKKTRNGARHMNWLERVCIFFSQTARQFVEMYMSLLYPA